MNLIIDIGNSKAKVAIYSHSKLITKKSINNIDVNNCVNELLYKYNVKKGIFSSVGKISVIDFKNLDSKKIPFIELNHETNFPFNNLYKTPKTLGVDRLALMSASVKDYSNENVLVIDAGTCITYDFIDNENNYLGGAISPGVHMRYKSLNNLTANLPLLKPRYVKNIIGNSTTKAIHSGVVKGVLLEIDGVINTYKEKYEDLTVILTGGDSKFLSKQLKNSIFANSNFLLEGLNYILEFNSK
ncbi:MAG: type III pantothenate kinase [Flavobacteriaceae bacterium]|nr:type III pantothenate kinase [Flavobacteriaceae bacterium]